MSEGLDKGEGHEGTAMLLGGRISSATATGLIPGVEPLGHGYD